MLRYLGGYEQVPPQNSTTNATGPIKPRDTRRSFSSLSIEQFPTTQHTTRLFPGIAAGRPAYGTLLCLGNARKETQLETRRRNDPCPSDRHTKRPSPTTAELLGTWRTRKRRFRIIVGVPIVSRQRETKHHHRQNNNRRKQQP